MTRDTHRLGDSGVANRWSDSGVANRWSDSGVANRWSDSGVAMVLVMAWGLLMLGLVLVVSQAVINQIRPSDRSEKS